MTINKRQFVKYKKIILNQVLIDAKNLNLTEKNLILSAKNVKYQKVTLEDYFLKD